MDSAPAGGTSESIRETLHAATFGQHRALERMQAMKRLFAADFTLAEYRAHLERLLGFHEPLERAAARDSRRQSTPHEMGRVGALRDDLAALGATARDIDALRRCTDLPGLSAAAVWGSLYVVMGSMLGGRVIAAQLRRTLGRDVTLHFYGQCVSEGETRWSSFCAELERQNESNLPSMCAAAVATFDAYGRWMNAEAMAGGRA